MPMMDYRQTSYVYDNSSFHLLDSSLSDILLLIRPTEIDQAKRLNTINDVRNAVQSVASLKGAAVKPFGSFTSNLYTKWGDLDISIQVSSSPYYSVSRKQKQNLLRDLMRAFMGTGWGHMKFIPHARVPLLVFESSSRNISCDISIDNHAGQIKSKILLWIAEIDGRFRDMVLLIKEWAKAHNINDPKAGTLNSYSLCLLIIFHFQTCSPAILPPLKDIYGGNLVNDFEGLRSDSERQIENRCAANIAYFRPHGGKNKSTLCHLLTSFFQKFSGIHGLTTDTAVCTYSGKRESVWDKPQWSGKSYKLIVEDPFEQPDNAARAVDERGLAMISNAFACTYRRLTSSEVLSDRNALFSVLARPLVVAPMGRTAPRIERSNGGAHGHDMYVRVGAHRAVTQGTRAQMYNTTAAAPRHPLFWNGSRLASGDRPSSSSSTSSRRQPGAAERQSRMVWAPRPS